MISRGILYSKSDFSAPCAVIIFLSNEARKFVQPMTAFLAEKHSGALKSHYSFGNVSTNDVIIRAIKKAENSDEIIVRLNEGSNKSVDHFTLELGSGIEAAREVLNTDCLTIHNKCIFICF